MIHQPRVPALHLAKYSDRPQARCSLQQRHNLTVPIRLERVGASPSPRLALLRGRPGIGIEPGARAGAETRLRRGGLAGVSASVCHVQLCLLIGDVCAGHLGDLFWAVESPAIPARRHGVAGAFPTRGTASALVAAYSRATPDLRSPPASSILIDARNHPDCRCAGGLNADVRSAKTTIQQRLG